MNCPYCENESIVQYSISECDAVHRRRKCPTCGCVWYTIEVDAKDAKDFGRALKARRIEREKENRA